MNPQVFGKEHLLYISVSMVTALDGTIFAVWVIAPIYMAVYALILWIVELVRRRKTTNK